MYADKSMPSSISHLCYLNLICVKVVLTVGYVLPLNKEN